MISDDQIRALCAVAAKESDPDECKQVAAAVKMVSAQYLREHSLFLAHSDSERTKEENTRKRAA
jgi:hypothetical protein